MMNCMGQGFAATPVGGIQIADWALAFTYVLLVLMFVIGFFALIRTVIALWRGGSYETCARNVLDGSTSL